MVDITIRELEEKDLFNGFLESMDSLKLASNLNREKAKEIFEKINSNSNHFVYVAILDGRVVGSTSMIIEPKFIHDGGNVAHIEDVVVSQEYQGKRIKLQLWDLGGASRFRFRKCSRYWERRYRISSINMLFK